jgi:hypothetical protein
MLSIGGRLANEGLEYVRRLYENQLKWYTDAQTRAQAALTFDGALLAVFTGVLISKSEEVRGVIDIFEWHTWLALGVTAAGILASIISAVLVLQARPLTKNGVGVRMAGVDKENAETYNAKVLWYFQLIANLKENPFVEKTGRVTGEDERDILARQTFILAGRLTQKYKLLFWTFLGTAVALLGLVGFAASYVLSV